MFEFVLVVKFAGSGKKMVGMVDNLVEEWFDIGKGVELAYLVDIYPFEFAFVIGSDVLSVDF